MRSERRRGALCGARGAGRGGARGGAGGGDRRLGPAGTPAAARGWGRAGAGLGGAEAPGAGAPSPEPRAPSALLGPGPGSLCWPLTSAGAPPTPRAAAPSLGTLWKRSPLGRFCVSEADQEVIPLSPPRRGSAWSPTDRSPRTLSASAPPEPQGCGLGGQPSARKFSRETCLTPRAVWGGRANRLFPSCLGFPE